MKKDNCLPFAFRHIWRQLGSATSRKMSALNSTSRTTYRLGFLQFLPWFDVKEDGTLTGINPHMIKDLSTSLNFDYELLMSPDGSWGQRHPDGNWTGIMGMIQRQECDMFAIPVAANILRQEVIRYSGFPYFTGHLTILSGVNRNVEDNLFGLLVTFDMEVWAVIALSMFVLVTTSVLVDRVDQQGAHVTDTMGVHFWNILATFFSEGTPKNPQKNLNKFLIVIWSLSVLTLMSAFTGHFKSTLTVRKEPKQIDNIEDLGNAKNVKPLVWKGSSYETLFRNSDLESMKKVAKMVIEQNGFVPINEMYTRTNYEMTVKGQVALVTETSTLKTYLGHMCAGGKGGNVHLAKETVMSVPLYLGMGKHLPNSFRMEVNDRIYRYTESGLIWKWMNDMYQDSGKCLVTENSQPEEKTLEFKDMRIIFLLWFISLVLSLLAYLYEFTETIGCRRNVEIPALPKEEIY